MSRFDLLAGCLALALVAPGVAAADPWKDESGHGKHYGKHWERPAHHPPRYAQPNIPPGHRPPPGHCRDWIPGVPPGHQPPPYRC